MKSWTEEFFDQQYLEMFMTRSSAELEHVADVLLAASKLVPGQRVADFCCGQGDILSELSRRGIEGVGVELCQYYVQQAQEAYGAAGVVAGDALTHKFEEEFDLTYNWYSSFGYLGKEGDKQLLRNMFCQTKPGGLVLLESLNANYVLQNFQPLMTYPATWRGKAYTVARASTLDRAMLQLRQTWRFQSSETAVDRHTTMQLYFIDELSALMADVGLEHVQVWEAPTNAEQLPLKAPDSQSRRLILTGRKPL